MEPKIITVTGPVDPEEMGLTLAHEHILVDFIGAEKSGAHRYSKDDVVATMLPYLEAVRHQGVRSFIDATPMYLGRDVDILSELSRLTDLRIVTNTGQYKEPYLPRETFDSQPETIAAGWIEEFRSGIDGTDVKPGFIKTAVAPGPLSAVAEKVITAAAISSRQTGLSVATHCGCAVAAQEILNLFENHQVAPQKWVFVHAQNEGDLAALRSVARRGAWIELDGIGEGSEEKHMIPLLAMLEAGFESQLLLSQDAGWYRVGEEPGGAKKAFTFLLDSFVPQMKGRGISESMIRSITSENPSHAFGVSV